MHWFLYIELYSCILLILRNLVCIHSNQTHPNTSKYIQIHPNTSRYNTYIYILFDNVPLPLPFITIVFLSIPYHLARAGPVLRHCGLGLTSLGLQRDATGVNGLMGWCCGITYDLWYDYPKPREIQMIQGVWLWEGRRNSKYVIEDISEILGNLNHHHKWQHILEI